MNNNNPLISVVIPTLNTRPQFLKETIKSIENQTYLPSEIIIINNGKDELKIPECSLPIQQFKIMSKAGVAQARNFGVCVANTIYVAFLDDDDFWDLNYLKYIKTKIDYEEPDCLIANLDQFKDEKILEYKNADGLVNQNIILVKNPGITGSSVVVKKDSFMKVGGYDPKLPPSEDKSLILEFMQNKFKIVTVPKSKAILRQHPQENRLSSDRRMAEGIFQFYIKYKDQMSINQKIYNLYKLKRYKWLTKKSFINGVQYLFFFIYIEAQRIFKK